MERSVIQGWLRRQDRSRITLRSVGATILRVGTAGRDVHAPDLSIGAGNQPFSDHSRSAAFSGGPIVSRLPQLCPEPRRRAHREPS
jgi:hypothetical protein